jgi:hypothetical protein
MIAIKEEIEADVRDLNPIPGPEGPASGKARKPYQTPRLILPSKLSATELGTGVATDGITPTSIS